MLSLGPDGIHHDRSGMSQGIHRHTGHAIKIAMPFGVPDVGTLTPRNSQIARSINAEKMIVLHE